MSQASHQQSHISSRAFVSFVSELIGTGANPNPDDSTPPGPWDPYIRQALNRVRLTSGFSPAPSMPTPILWREDFGPLPDPWMLVALNPQPLPPRVAFPLAIAQEVISHVELAQQIAEAIGHQGEEQGIIIVGGIVSRFVDDCGNGRIWRKRPFPIPPPFGDADDRLTALELVVMGAQFEQSARTTVNERLQHEFKRAGSKLIEMGIARM